MRRTRGADGRGEAVEGREGEPPTVKAKRQVTLYCDGACRGNPGVGGYGVILICDGHEKELSGAVSMTTNNRMELTAAIVGLETLTEPCKVSIFTDSQYMKKGITVWIHAWRARGWRTTDRKGVRNRELWEKLLELCERHEAEWGWVPGHSGDALNERCDDLANEAIERLLAERAD